MKKHLLSYALALGALLSFATAASAGILVSAPQATAQASIQILSPLGGAVDATDTIPVALSETGIIGPVYIYLYDPVLKQIVATTAVAKSAFDASGKASASFNLGKSKASSYIKPGAYGLVACDGGRKSSASLCSATVPLSVLATAPVISNIYPAITYGGGSVTIVGSGFDANSYALLDGGYSSLVMPQAGTSGNILTLKILPGVSAGAHTIQIGERSNSTLKPSGAVAFTVITAGSPYINTLSAPSGKVGDVVTVTGTGFSSAYPSKVEFLQNGKVAASIDPSATNAFAISSDGTLLRFLLDASTTASMSAGVYELRVSNGDVLKSNAESFTLGK